jgi:hypothetical protein
MWEEVLGRIFLHNQYYGHTMPKTNMISTLGNLRNNSKHSVVVTFEHATFTNLIMANWSLIFT